MDLADIKNQVLTDYLQIRRRAIESHQRGSSWGGLTDLETLISCIPLSKNGRERADEIVASIDEIEYKSNGVYKKSRLTKTKDLSSDNREKFKQKAGRTYFNEYLQKLTDILRDEGYFEFLPNSSSLFVDPARGRKSGRRRK